VLLCASLKSSKSDGHSNSHTDELFTRRWACSFGTCVQPTDFDGLLHSSNLQFRCVISVEFLGNSKQSQRHDSVNLSSAYTDYSFSSNYLSSCSLPSEEPTLLALYINNQCLPQFRIANAGLDDRLGSEHDTTRTVLIMHDSYK